MAVMEAFLDDFGKVIVSVSRNFYNGNAGGFYLVREDGTENAHDCVVRSVEEHSREVRYELIIPTDFSFRYAYTVRESHGLKAPLQMRFITQSDAFEKMFDYDGDDLGPTYHSFYTDFALWSPVSTHASVCLWDHNGYETTYSMNRSDKGVWRVRIKGDLKHCTYVYLLEQSGKVVKTTDPYALSSTANGRASAVIDPSVLNQVKDPGVHSVIHSLSDCIVYECSVRDMTSSIQTGTSTNGKFLSLSEEGTRWRGRPTGLDYLAQLGVTHVQFQPVNDFATVDEFHPERSYNWGYDPEQLLCLEGSYATDPQDPYCRMLEFKRMIAVLHAKGLRVNIDVVFNHMYDAENCSLFKTVPYYFFRYNENGYYSNGSGCGNDLESRRHMMRRYFLHIIRTWMTLYGVDGFRFDLMGILDVETMNMIHDAARKIKPDAMIYGEGWDMPTCLPENEKSRIYNQHHMPGIGHFNDTFRDVAKGRSADDAKYDKGYLTGNTGMAHDMCSALTGNSMQEPYFRRFDTPVQSVNAIETHDNATAWDKMHACCADEPRDTRKRRQRMMIACTMTAQGIPFIHAGFEYCGTKQDNSNSYNAGDTINGMNWDRAVLNEDVLEYAKKAIALRKACSAFHLSDAAQVNSRIHFSIVDDCVIFYDIDEDNPVSKEEGIRVIINPTMDQKQYYFEGSWRVIFDENGNKAQEQSEHVTVPWLSVIVLVKYRN